jgi:predicted PurR-regulated permease PerM
LQPPTYDARTERLNQTLRILAIVALTLGILTFAIRVLLLFRGIAPIVIFSVLLIYLAAAVIGLLRRIMNKHLAVAVTFIGMFAALAILITIVGPPLVKQVQLFAAALPEATIRAHSVLSDPNSEIGRRLSTSFRDDLAELPNRVFSLLTRYAVALGRQGLSAILAGVSLALVFIIIPVLAAYALFDYLDLQRALVGFFPKERRPQVIAIMHDLSDVMGAFVRGQALDGLCVGFMIYVLLLVMRVPFALVIAVAAGVLNLIPYAGAIAGFIPSVLLALAYNGWQNALIVGIGFAVIQQIDGDIIVPRIMNASVKLSPVIVILSIIAFGSQFGILGALVAVPIAGMLRVLKLHFAPAPSPAEFELAKAEALPMMKFKPRQ